MCADHQPAVWRVPREAHSFIFSGAAEPALKITPGDYVVFETLDCFSNKLTSPQQCYEREEDLLHQIGAYNPVTGPVHVAGAQSGDVLAVRILDIEIGTAAPFAVTNSFGTGAKLVDHACPGMPPQGSTRICPISHGHIDFPLNGRTLSLPARPMVGTIGTAPAGRDIGSVHYSRVVGGNMDCPLVRAGAEVYLPVNVPGALLYLGDVHALMGDAEITGTALETSADVTVQVGLLPGSEHELTTPHVDSTQAIGAIGCTEGASLEANLQTAMVELQQRLSGHYGLAPVDAYELLGAVAQVNVNQCVPRSWKSVYAGIDRRFLPPHAAPARPGGPAGEDDHAAA